MLFFEAKKAGISYTEFWDMTFPEFFWAVDSARLQNEVQWTHTRELLAITFNTNAKKGKSKTAKKLVPLSIDTPIKKKVGDSALSFEDFKKVIAERSKFKGVKKEIVKNPDKDFR